MAYQNVYDIIPLSKAQPKLAFSSGLPWIAAA